MKIKKSYWKYIPVVVSIVSVVVSLYVPYDIYGKENQHHSLDIYHTSTSNPSSSLSSLGDELELKLNGSKIENLYIVRYVLINSGDTAILPSDYYEEISLSTIKPWKIIGVVNDNSFPESFELKWNRVSDEKYEITPVLVNSKDNVSISVYVSGGKTTKEEDIPLVWSARIKNLDDIQLREYLMEIHLENGLLVVLSGLALPFTLCFFILLFFVQLFLSIKTKLICYQKIKSVLIVVFMSLLSISTGEILAFYISKPVTGTGFDGQGGVINGFILAIQVLFIVLLLMRLISRIRRYKYLKDLRSK